MSRYPRELAVYEAACARLKLAHDAATPQAKSDIAAARELLELLFHQCSAYHVALRSIVEIAKQGGMTDIDIFNVTDNLDQPL